MHHFMSERQKACWLAIRDFRRRHGYSPAMRDLMTALEVNMQSVIDVVRILVRHGHVTEAGDGDAKCRTWCVVEDVPILTEAEALAAAVPVHRFGIVKEHKRRGPAKREAS